LPQFLGKGPGASNSSKTIDPTTRTLQRGKYNVVENSESDLKLLGTNKKKKSPYRAVRSFLQKSDQEFLNKVSSVGLNPILI